MKPCTVEFQAFGPYAGHELVDFEKLAASIIVFPVPVLPQIRNSPLAADTAGTILRQCAVRMRLLT